MIATRPALDLQPGDVIRFLGTDHVFSHYEPAGSITRLHLGDEAQLAVCTDDWRITCAAGQTLDVLAVAS